MEEPYITLGTYATVYYFAHFIVILPLLGRLEDILSFYGRTEEGKGGKGKE